MDRAHVVLHLCFPDSVGIGRVVSATGEGDHLVPFSHAFFFFHFQQGWFMGRWWRWMGGWMSGSYLNLSCRGREGGERKKEEGACGFDGLGFFSRVRTCDYWYLLVDFWDWRYGICI